MLSPLFLRAPRTNTTATWELGVLPVRRHRTQCSPLGQAPDCAGVCYCVVGDTHAAAAAALRR